MTKMMTIAEIQHVADMNMVEYDDAADRKRKGLDQYYVNFVLDDGGHGSFDEHQDRDDEVEVYYD